MFPFHRFKSLSVAMQVEELSRHGVALDLAYSIQQTEAVLFAYHDFYVELVVIKYTDEILAIKCFKSTKKLEPYLHQVDIAKITALLTC